MVRYSTGWCGVQSSRLPLRVPLRKRHLRLDPPFLLLFPPCVHAIENCLVDGALRSRRRRTVLSSPSLRRTQGRAHDRASGSCSIRAFRDSLYSNNEDDDDDSVCNHDSIKGLFPRNTTTISIKRGGDFNACKVVVISGGSHR